MLDRDDIRVRIEFALILLGIALAFILFYEFFDFVQETLGNGGVLLVFISIPVILVQIGKVVRYFGGWR